MKKILLLTAALSLAFTSCMRDGDWDDCPGGETRIQVYTERFQSKEGLSLVENSEELFNTRIGTMTYYLYRNGDLVESGPVSGIAALTGQTWPFSRPALAYGDYSLLLVANTDNNTATGRAVPAIDLVYPGYDLTADYFMNRFDFKVENADDKNYTTQLKRVHGIVRFNFIDLPADVTGIGVELDGLASHSYIDGSYAEKYTLSRLLPHTELERDAQNNFSFSVMAYPTLPDEATSWRVKLYRDGSEEPYYDESVMANLHVLRNDLLDLTMDFSQGDFRFFVGLDDQWDGWHQVGGPVFN